MDSIVLLTFLICSGTIVVVSWIKTRNQKLDTIAAIFFANKKLGFVAVGFGLLFANINTALFIGENELTYTNNMSVMAWGLTSVIAMLIVSEWVMPIYLRHGISTTPEYLGIRYDAQTKTIVTIIFLLNYLINFLPAVLYSGAVALNGVFRISASLGTDYWATLWIIIWCLGTAGALYSLLGGQKAITISDTLLGAAMFTGGLLLPYFGCKAIGSGDWYAGLQKLLSTKTNHLNAIGHAGDAVPFSTIFTGMFLVNLYYWGTEQYIVQQVLGSKNLASCQKGIALAGFGKILCLLLINIPGVMAVHLFPDLGKPAEAFPRFLTEVAPPAYTGFIAALLFGASFTTFNAGLNGASTLFTLNLYKPWAEIKYGECAERKLVRVAKRFELLICLAAMLVAPFLIFASRGFYQHVQQFSSLFSVPIFTVMAVGLLTKKVPPLAAKLGLCFFIIIYGVIQFLLPLQMHFLHVTAMLFVATIILMMVIGRLRPLQVAEELRIPVYRNLEPWKNRHLIAAVLISVVIGLYILFSPLGLVH